MVPVCMDHNEGNDHFIHHKGILVKFHYSPSKRKTKVKTTVSISTCNHAVSCSYAIQHLLDEPHFCARLQVADALLQDGGEYAPHLRLTSGLALVQQLHHAADALWFLDDEVHLQVKLASNQLRHNRRQRVQFQSTLKR